MENRKWDCHNVHLEEKMTSIVFSSSRRPILPMEAMLYQIVQCVWAECQVWMGKMLWKRMQWVLNRLNMNRFQWNRVWKMNDLIEHKLVCGTSWTRAQWIHFVARIFFFSKCTLCYKLIEISYIMRIKCLLYDFFFFSFSLSCMFHNNLLKI